MEQTLTTEQKERIVSDEEQFRLHVMECLGELAADMKSIVGNGQPGRLSQLEAKVAKHDWYIATVAGAGMVLGYIVEHGIPAVVAKLLVTGSGH